MADEDMKWDNAGDKTSDGTTFCVSVLSRALLMISDENVGEEFLSLCRRLEMG
jgi:hypothetical protein